MRDIYCHNALFYRICLPFRQEGRRGRDRMVVRFTTTYAISAYHQ